MKIEPVQYDGLSIDAVTARRYLGCRKPRRPDVHLYFAATPTGVKVGVSRCVQQRIRSLNNPCGIRTRPVGVCDSAARFVVVILNSDRLMEADIHSMCADEALGAEWFLPKRALQIANDLALIAEVRKAA